MRLYIKYYYTLKPFLSRGIVLALRKVLIRMKILCGYAKNWPIDESISDTEAGWTEWPDGKDFSLVLTHDVEWGGGCEKCRDLATLEEKMGFRSSFNFVPERYEVSPELRAELVERGFEVGVHGLNHDGKLYSSRKLFRERAVKINEYLRDWESVGFRSPSAHHNLEWLHDLNIEYDASTFDTDPFEPQPDAVGKIFPFWHPGQKSGEGYMELPYTLPQDILLFILMQHDNIDVWKEKLAWVAKRGGMALIITHPDYMHFGSGKLKSEEYPSDFYKEFLMHLKEEYAGRYWHALPKDITRFSKEQGMNKTEREDR